MPAKISLASCYQCGGDATGCDCGQKLEDKQDEKMRESGICPRCLQDLEPIYENNGFTAPDPEHHEITGYKQCECQANNC